MKRQRVQLEAKPRPELYIRMRRWWLQELSILRAKRRISGTATKKDIKIAQKELQRLRREYV